MVMPSMRLNKHYKRLKEEGATRSGRALLVKN